MTKRIGIDVGGTNTDAVLMDGIEVVAWHKTPTTPDVGGGIVVALASVMAEGGVGPGDVGSVMIGTTHFTNAVVERRRLLPVAAVRLGLPATKALPPMIDWPEDLRATLGGHHYLIRGGHEFDGREIAPLDEKGLREAARDIRKKGLQVAAVTSVFSPVTAEMEERAAEILSD